MNESFKALVEIFVPVISSLLTAVIAWFLRGKYENKKIGVEMEQQVLTLRKEEIKFRGELMAQVLQLEKTVHQQSLQIEDLRQLVQEQASQLEDLKQLVEEKDEQIKQLQNEKSS